MDMSRKNHNFAIILPSCLDRPQRLSVFPLSSPLQKSELYITNKDTGTDLRSRKEV